MTVTTAVIPLTEDIFGPFEVSDHVIVLLPKLFQILVFTVVSDSPSQLFGRMYFFLRSFSFVSFFIIYLFIYPEASNLAKLV